MAGYEGNHTEWLTPDARLGGIHIGNTCKVKWGENVVADYADDIE